MDDTNSRTHKLGEKDQRFSIHMGAIAFGGQVMKSGTHPDAIAKQENAIAFKVEGAGVWAEVPCIVVKGVCDYADFHKSNRWQYFAAATAVSTTKAILLRSAQTDRLSTAPPELREGPHRNRTSINSYGENVEGDFFYRKGHI